MIEYYHQDNCNMSIILNVPNQQNIKLVNY